MVRGWKLELLGWYFAEAWYHDTMIGLPRWQRWETMVLTKSWRSLNWQSGWKDWSDFAVITCPPLPTGPHHRVKILIKVTHSRVVWLHIPHETKLNPLRRHVQRYKKEAFLQEGWTTNISPDNKRVCLLWLWHTYLGTYLAALYIFAWYPVSFEWVLGYIIYLVMMYIDYV